MIKCLLRDEVRSKNKNGARKNDDRLSSPKVELKLNGGHSEVLTKELLFKIISKYNRAWNSFDSTVIIPLYPNLKYEGPIRHREGRENLLNW